MILWIGLAVLVVILGYVRFAPGDLGRWHTAMEFSSDKDFKSGVVRVVEAGPDGLARWDGIVRRAKRTDVLAGSVAEGLVTYITRSAVFGFPDYTTAQQDADQLIIYARSRFGGSDSGVNNARVSRWLDALQSR